MDEKEFEILKKLTVEITKNQLVMQKELIKLKQADLNTIHKMKEIVQATSEAIKETRDLISRQRNLDNIVLAS